MTTPLRTPSTISAVECPTELLLANVRRTFEAGLALIDKKNRDYGAAQDAFANFRAVELLGLTVEQGILVRTLDKLTRINNLLTQPAYVTEESMEDTILDAINYLALLKAYREQSK